MKVDQATGQVTLAVDGGTSAEATSDAVWVAVDEQQLVKIDPVSCQTLLTIPVAGIVYFGVGLGSVWVPVEGRLLRFDERTGELLATIDAGTFLKNVAVGDDAVWVAAKDAGMVLRIDAATNTVVAQVEMGGSPQDLEIDEHGVWVTDNAATLYEDSPGSPASAGRVALIDPATNEIAATIEGIGSGGIAVGGGYIWVTTQGRGVQRLDPQTYATTTVLELAELNYSVAYGDEELWVPSTEGWLYRVPLPAE